MSYSFSVKAKSKAEACAQIKVKLADVVHLQPIHAKDQAQAQAAAEAFINLMAIDETKDIAVSMNGSTWESAAGTQQVSVSVSVSFAARVV